MIAGISNAENKFSFGPKAGINSSSFRGSEANNFDSKVGFFAGGFCDFELTNHFMLQMEILYTTKGAQKEYTDSFSAGAEQFSNTTITQKYDLKYIEVPLLIKYKPFKGSNVDFNLFAGPSIAKKLNGQYKEEGGPDPEQTGLRDLEELEEIDVGFILGGGIGIPIGHNQIIIDIRYDLGYTNSLKVKHIKNSVASLTLGFAF